MYNSVLNDQPQVFVTMKKSYEMNFLSKNEIKRHTVDKRVDKSSVGKQKFKKSGC